MLGKIAWYNIIYKPLNSALCVSLITFGVAIMSLLYLIQSQLEKKFEQDLQNIDLVMGAKGSPLQLVLSAVYHLDAPTGNIQLKEAQKIMESPMVKEAIPLAYGDSYKGYRILGTTSAYLERYKAKIAHGSLFKSPMETTIGAHVAKKTGLKVGDRFLSTHGGSVNGHVHKEHYYKVVGVLQKTNTVVDKLLISNINSVWQVHSSNSEDHEHTHLEDESETSTKSEIKSHQHINTKNEKKEITAVLLNYKTKMAALTMPRIINQQTNMQAVSPTVEINRLLHLIGIGATTLQLISYGIMFMAGFSLFFVLYSRLKDRRHELALMRSVGYQPKHLFGLLLLEAFLLSTLGYVFGWLLSRIGLFYINRQAESDFKLEFNLGFTYEESWLLILTLIIGIIASLLPAFKAMKIDVSTTLSKK